MIKNNSNNTGNHHHPQPTHMYHKKMPRTCCVVVAAIGMVIVPTMLQLYFGFTYHRKPESTNRNTVDVDDYEATALLLLNDHNHNHNHNRNRNHRPTKVKTGTNSTFNNTLKASSFTTLSNSTTNTSSYATPHWSNNVRFVLVVGMKEYDYSSNTNNKKKKNENKNDSNANDDSTKRRRRRIGSSILEKIGRQSPIYRRLVGGDEDADGTSSSTSRANPKRTRSSTQLLYKNINKSLRILFSIGSSKTKLLFQKEKSTILKTRKNQELKEDGDDVERDKNNNHNRFCHLDFGGGDGSDSVCIEDLQDLYQYAYTQLITQLQQFAKLSSSTHRSDVPLNIFRPTDSIADSNNNTNDTNNNKKELLLSSSYSNTNTRDTNDYHLTYPFSYNVRQWNEYPNLDLFYAICTKAKVSCGHIYIHNSKSQQYSNTQPRKMNEEENADDIVSQFMKLSPVSSLPHSTKYWYGFFLILRIARNMIY